MYTQISIADTKTKFHKNPLSNSVRVTCDKTDRQDKVKVTGSFLYFWSETRPYQPHFVANDFSQISQFLQFSFWFPDFVTALTLLY